MFEVFAVGVLSFVALLASYPPDISGNWAGEDWGDVVLKQANSGEYSGTYREINGSRTGEIRLKWSAAESRFNGTWAEGQERFGDLSIRLVDNEILGAYTNLLKTKAIPGAPGLGDLAWSRGLGKIARPLDMKPAYQTSAARFVKEKRFPWYVCPHGANTFGNIPLAIDGRICLWGESNTKMGLKFPERSRDIPVNRTFDTLYVYHTAFFQSPDGSPMYDLIMQYADDTSSTTTLCYGTHVRDWFQHPDDHVVEPTDPNSKLVWRGNDPHWPEGSAKLRFFVTSVKNPSAAVEVKTIKLVSSKGNSAGCILAMTTGPAGLLKVDSPDVVAAPPVPVIAPAPAIATPTTEK